MKNCFIILLLLTLLPFGLYSQTFQVKVVGISDGDTFTGLNRDNLQLKFRIHGIDAPEKKQAFGSKAREHLGSLIFGQNVTVDVNDRDRWGRYIARVATEDGRDVGNEMLQAGLAWHYKHFDKSEAYAQAEQKARDNKRGLWSDPGAVAPWEFRKKKN
ncbi:MAG: thermonuclease family protein [Bacteroidales bacterium]|nr:thermonuclease family protein [Bacteroidales bacterium]